MQNAIDACLEMKDFLRDGQARPVDLTDQDADVVITLEQISPNERYLTVADQGIGMTSSVVLDYFLKAGASFRRSDAWRQQHESSSGESRVLRSGRFGVGALAAFLLGDEINVSTRHVRAELEQGISFTATLDTEEIQLNHFLGPIGTTVRVKISRDDVWKELTAWHWDFVYENAGPNPLRQWDFYCVGGVTVKRVLIENGKPSLLATIWARIAGELIIPYDLKQRMLHFKDAYNALHPLIQYYEKAREANADERDSDR